MTRRRIIYEAPAQALSAQFRTFAQLAAVLLRPWVPVGARAALWGPVGAGLVGWWRRYSEGGDPYADLRVDSEVCLREADASTFSIGAEGSGSDIEYLGATNPLSWAPPGPSGGLVQDGAAAVFLPCLGEYEGDTGWHVDGFGVPTLTTQADNQFIVAGHSANNNNVGLRGGARRVAGLWYAAFHFGDPAAPSIGGDTSPAYRRDLITGRELQTQCAVQVTSTPSNYTSYIAGCYVGDASGDEEENNAASSTSAAASSFDDQRVCLAVSSATEAASAITMRWTRLASSSSRRLTGATP